MLIPIVIERLGSSTVETGSGRGSSGSASVSPIVTSGRPATATISPGPASSASTGRAPRSRRARSPSRARSGRRRGTRRPAGPCGSSRAGRASASRPTYGDASRFVTSACSGWSGSCSGGGIVSSRSSKSGCRSSASASGSRPARFARVRVRDRELDLALVGVEVEEELVDLVHDLLDPRVRPVDLVDDEDHRQLRLERLAEDEAGLRQRPLARVDEQEDAVDHRQPALDLAAEVGVARRVDDVDLRRRRGRRCSWRGS